MLPRLLLALALAAVTIAGARAQGDQTLADKFALDLSGAWGGWNFQLTELGDQNAIMQGGFGGLEFNKTLFLGWGAYKLQDRVNLAGDADDSGAGDIDFRYNGPVIRYTPRARSVVHPMFGLQAGFGKIDLDFDDPEVDDPGTDKVFILQPTVGGELNVTRWCRLGAELGYRYALNTELPEVGDGFANGLYGAATLRFGFSWGTGDGDVFED